MHPDLPYDPSIRRIRIAFAAYSFVLPLVLALSGLVAPDAMRALIAMHGDLFFGLAVLVLPLFAATRAPELLPALLHVGAIGFASVLFSRSLADDQWRTFALAFVWSIIAIILALRKNLDWSINLYAMIGHLVGTAAAIHGILTWIRG